MVPRIFGIPALRAHVVAVVRRGPSDWMHLGRWDVATPAYPPGAWLRGTIHPQRCDLSPDGRWFAYFALKPGAGWEGAGVDVLRDLTPAVADGACGVGDRQHVDTGVRFVEDASVWEVDPPDLGDAGPVRERFGLQMSRADSFSVERRRGWTETADTPPRDPSDAWGEARGTGSRWRSPALGRGAPNASPSGAPPRRSESCTGSELTSATSCTAPGALGSSRASSGPTGTRLRQAARGHRRRSPPDP